MGVSDIELAAAADMMINLACFTGYRNSSNFVAPRKFGDTVTILLILHGLIAVALLGSITHQSVALLRSPAAPAVGFTGHYAGVSRTVFTRAIVVLYVLIVALGACLYPSYRIDVRISFEEMSMGWAVGLFELKEHFAAVGLGILPLYTRLWSAPADEALHFDRKMITLLLAFIVWWDFLVGHVLNNIRGLG